MEHVTWMEYLSIWYKCKCNSVTWMEYQSIWYKCKCYVPRSGPPSFDELVHVWFFRCIPRVCFFLFFFFSYLLFFCWMFKRTLATMSGVMKPRMDDNTCFCVKLYTFIVIVTNLFVLYDDIWRFLRWFHP